MVQLQISSPEMKELFETKFHSNQEKFMEFIISFVQENRGAIDHYFHKQHRPTFTYKTLNPMEHYYTLPVDDMETEMTNPFKDVTDPVSFAKKLRENSYR